MVGYKRRMSLYHSRGLDCCDVTPLDEIVFVVVDIHGMVVGDKVAAFADVRRWLNEKSRLCRGDFVLLTGSRGKGQSRRGKGQSPQNERNGLPGRSLLLRLFMTLSELCCADSLAAVSNLGLTLLAT